jgi:hypothetical protein
MIIIIMIIIIIFVIIIYKEMSIDCDWSISLQKSVTTVQKSVATVQKSVTKKSDWLHENTKKFKWTNHAQQFLKSFWRLEICFKVENKQRWLRKFEVEKIRLKFYHVFKKNLKKD